MSNSPPIEPVFTRRLRITKRRQRITSHSDSSDETSAPVSAFRLKPRTEQPTRKRRLRAPPVVPGYEPTVAAAVVSGGDYSVDGLAKLRRQSAAVANGVKATEKRREGESGQGRLKAADGKERQSALGRAKSAEVDVLESVLGRDKAAQSVQKGDLKGARGRPDPFSTEWRTGGMRDIGRDEDGDAMVVDDFAEIDGDAAYVGMKNGGGVEEEESDGEWEKEQLRRSGHMGVVRSDVERMMEMRRIVRDEEDAMIVASGRKGGFERSMEMVRMVRVEWENRLAVGEEKVARLEEVEKRSRREGREVERGIEEKRKEVVFFDGLAAHVDDVADMLREKHEVILEYREEILKRMRKEVEEVESVLKGRPDEFGRVRNACLELPEMDGSFADGLMDPLEDVEEEVRSIVRLIELFERWKRDFPEDYVASFGDAGLGKLAGTLALANQDDLLGWSRGLTDAQLKSAAVAFKAPLYISLLIRAKWRPREREAMKGLVSTIGRFVTVLSDNELIVNVFRDRAVQEMKAAFEVDDWEAAQQCVAGVIGAMQIVRRDVGVVDVLQEFDRRRKRAVESVQLRNLLRWVGDGADGLVEQEARGMARSLCESFSKEVVT